ncbi:nitrilotriacetate monooxygenase component A/pristinamycin IIA synthase subunit A [Burkholderia sp. THE68]|uniref:LLM class flavin-dependent oxidoreductase n=1 Tax=Burkholderia sp. THE68 TaxID=758782 RepID=UPI001315AEF3|nr:LLM class flavin-dependent oxidoreductase [Burkholderia sp. THE68]BBU30321.1 nitrilotriacetate monooxygenase component A/pristinamycin IIA synthase subunit A [Burkholderia sp. THE68]
MNRKLHLSAFMRPTTIHTGAWRYPGAHADANFNLKHLRSFVCTLERAKFDAFFMADHLAVLNMPLGALRHSHTVTSFEPLTLLSNLAAMTDSIGLVATASTTYEEPFHVARRFASLDHLSAGRAGWNIVTTANPDAAKNFGFDEHAQHHDRYDRASEFFKVVTDLWDSWADDAFIRDAQSGRYFDPARMRVPNHKGPHFSVRGPLNIARPPQGWPVIFQAGASGAGKLLAAETADVVFTAQATLSEGKRFYRELKRSVEGRGRSPSDIKIMPAAFVVVGESRDQAREIRERLDTLVHFESGLASLSIALGCEVAHLDPDGPLPEIPESNASQSRRQRIVELARKEALTIRQLAQRLGGFSGLEMVGTVADIADQMEQWLVEDAADGFTILFSHLPMGLEAFALGVVPELQRRHLFRTGYQGRTLREHLGLKRPPNRHFPSR